MKWNLSSTDSMMLLGLLGGTTMSDDNSQNSQAVEIRLFRDALSQSTFDRLLRAVRALGSERMNDNGSYSTTFWFPCDAQPTNIAEEAVVELFRQVEPGPTCIGMEWWLGRLGYGKRLRMHFDRDLGLEKQTGRCVHPLLSSVLYLNAYPSSPTLILDQVLSADEKTMIPAKPEFGKSIDAIPNHYVVFPGNLRHGVEPSPESLQRDSVTDERRRNSELRLTLLVNYWHRRPSPPTCMDYDGTIYSKLRDNP